MTPIGEKVNLSYIYCWYRTIVIEHLGKMIGHFRVGTQNMKHFRQVRRLVVELFRPINYLVKLPKQRKRTNCFNRDKTT